MSGTTHQVHVAVDAPYTHRCDAGSVRACVRAALESRNVKIPRVVSVRITDSRTIRRLNRRFRGEDVATDVLSFNTDFEELLRPDGASELGELVIAVPVAQRGANERGVSLDDELALLTVHGVLHLLGYDHETDAEDAEMRELERTALTLVGRVDAARPLLSAS